MQTLPKWTYPGEAYEGRESVEPETIGHAHLLRCCKGVGGGCRALVGVDRDLTPQYLQILAQEGLAGVELDGSFEVL